MKRKFVVFAVAAGLLALLALPVWAAYSEGQVEDLLDLYRQKRDIELEIVEKRLEMGLLPEERAGLLRERVGKIYEARREAIFEGKLYFGKEGMFKGPDDRRDFGWKQGGCPRGEYGPQPGTENSSTTY